jgi:hypothetical protein
MKETVEDPALLSSVFTEQIPDLFGSFGGGMLARGATKALMSDTIKASLGKAGAGKVTWYSLVVQLVLVKQHVRSYGRR